MDGSIASFSDPERGRTMDGDLDPNRIAADLELYGTQYAEANADAKLLEEQKAIVFSTLVQQYRDGSSPSGKRYTRADAEDMARISQDYQNHIETMVEARRLANNANARWRAAQARLDAMRTAEATRRAEMQALRR